MAYIIDSPTPTSYDKGLVSFSEDGAKFWEEIPSAPPQEMPIFNKLPRSGYIKYKECPYCLENDAVYIVDHEDNPGNKTVKVLLQCGYFKCQSDWIQEYSYNHPSQLKYILARIAMGQDTIRLKPKKRMFTRYDYRKGIINFLKKQDNKTAWVSRIKNSLHKQIKRDGTDGDMLFNMAADELIWDGILVLDGKKLTLKQ